MFTPMDAGLLAGFIRLPPSPPTDGSRRTESDTEVEELPPSRLLLDMLVLSTNESRNESPRGELCDICREPTLWLLFDISRLVVLAMSPPCFIMCVLSFMKAAIVMFAVCRNCRSTVVYPLFWSDWHTSTPRTSLVGLKMGSAYSRRSYARVLMALFSGRASRAQVKKVSRGILEKFVKTTSVSFLISLLYSTIPAEAVCGSTSETV